MTTSFIASYYIDVRRQACIRLGVRVSFSDLIMLVCVPTNRLLFLCNSNREKTRAWLCESNCCGTIYMKPIHVCNIFTQLLF